MAESFKFPRRLLYIDQSSVELDVVPTTDLELFFVQTQDKCSAKINLKPLAFSEFTVKIYIFAENSSQVDCVCSLHVEKNIPKVKTDIQIRSWPFDRSKISARPEMFIANSDVIATHGNALGILKPAEQYYLATRGVKDYKELVKQSLLEHAQLDQ